MKNLHLEKMKPPIKAVPISKQSDKMTNKQEQNLAIHGDIGLVLEDILLPFSAAQAPEVEDTEPADEVMTGSEFLFVSDEFNGIVVSSKH